MQLSQSINSQFRYFTEIKPEFQVPLETASPGHFKKASTHRNNINDKEIPVYFYVNGDLENSNLYLPVH